LNKRKWILNKIISPDFVVSRSKIICLFSFLCSLFWWFYSYSIRVKNICPFAKTIETWDSSPSIKPNHLYILTLIANPQPINSEHKNSFLLFLILLVHQYHWQKHLFIFRYETPTLEFSWNKISVKLIKSLFGILHHHQVPIVFWLAEGKYDVSLPMRQLIY
jgi:hypothetical protein